MTPIKTSGSCTTCRTPDTAPGFILTRQADLYGRCIAFVGRGDGPQPSGSAVFVDTQMLKTTANHHLISTGLVYPTYYRALFPDLRNELTSAAAAARTAGLGVWPQDRTTSVAEVNGLESLENDVVIVPKLFRRARRLPRAGRPVTGGFSHLPRSGRRPLLHRIHRSLHDRPGRKSSTSKETLSE